MNKRVALVAGAAACIVIGVAAAPKQQTYETCVTNKQELEAVAEIANATGQLPNGVHLATGERVSVNPNLCNASFPKPEKTHFDAAALQGNNQAVQSTINPQQ